MEISLAYLAEGSKQIWDSITESSPLSERAAVGGKVMLIGMSIVFGVLILLMAILYIFKLFSTKNDQTSVKAPLNNAPSAPVATDTDDEPVNVAVITAAIAAARGESDCAFNILSIKKIVK